MIFKYILVFGLCYFLGFYFHEALLTSNNISLQFSLQSLYLFHVIFSFLICALFSLLSKNKKLASQLGFLYLGALLLKLFIFTGHFKDIIFENIYLSKFEMFSILLPTLFFIFLEVYFIIKILRYTERYYK